MNKINVINLGMVNIFLIKGNGYVLVDTGVKTNYNKIISKLESLNIALTDIKLIILTHSHDDHIGGLDNLVESTGAKVMMHRLEYECYLGNIKNEIKPLVLLSKIIFKFVDIDNVTNDNINVDIIIDDDFDLNEYGINGKVIHTPGHTKGSISVLLDDGSAIIGDSIMALMPWSKPGIPVLAYDLNEIKKSTTKLVSLGANQFYLSHGKKYSKEVILEAIEKF